MIEGNDSTKVEVEELGIDIVEEQCVCKKCGVLKEAYEPGMNICVDCAKAEKNRANYLRMHQGDWLEIAEENGIDVWEKQPNETQWEYTIWVCFRDSYPGKRLTYREVALQLATTIGVVKKVAQRWSFSARMQAWVTYCDNITLAQRKQEILGMNKSHIDIARKIRNKLNTAVDMIEPATLRPSEIVSLAKLATDVERKAMLDTAAQESTWRDAHGIESAVGNNAAAPKKQDMQDILGILLNSGAIEAGVKTTTEVVVRSREDEQ